MANKKCPKCGEDNPAEAVMCWACYTPLTGGAAVATATAGAVPMAGAGARTATLETEDEKKKLDPKTLVIAGVLGVGLLIAAVVNFGLFGGSAPEDPIDLNMVTNGGSGGSGGSPSGPPPPPPPPPGGNGGGGGTSPAVAPSDPGYIMVSSPDPKSPIGAVGVFQNNVNGTQAVTLAKFVRAQYARNRWKGMQIFVFSDKAGADQFRNYQIKRRGAPLTPGDYASLGSSSVWNSAPVCLMSTGDKEAVYYPSKNPQSWWGRAS